MPEDVNPPHESRTSGARPVDGADIPGGVVADRDDVGAYLGAAFPAIATFHDLLADAGVLRGLIGPREVPRLWERHLLNSAAVAPFLPPSGSLVDVGSGAGFPGVVLAAMRPDLDVVLLEPMQRRVIWLQEVVEALGLASVEVVRGRAEELHGRRWFSAATASAVAPLDRLAAWTLPLLQQGGSLLALKGANVAEEVDAAAAVLRELGAGDVDVHEAGTVQGIEPTTVLRVVRAAPAVAARRTDVGAKGEGRPEPARRTSRAAAQRSRRGPRAR